MIKLLALMESLPGMGPGKQILHEVLGKTFGLVKASKQKLPEHFHDDRGVQGRKRQKLSFRSENSIGDDCVAMRMEITAEGPMVCRETIHPGRTSLRWNRVWNDLRMAL
jgi:hypothetical protein